MLLCYYSKFGKNSKVQIQKEVASDLKYKNPIFFRSVSLFLNWILRRIAYMESLSEFALWAAYMLIYSVILPWSILDLFTVQNRIDYSLCHTNIMVHSGQIKVDVNDFRYFPYAFWLTVVTKVFPFQTSRALSAAPEDLAVLEKISWWTDWLQCLASTDRTTQGQEKTADLRAGCIMPCISWSIPRGQEQLIGGLIKLANRSSTQDKKQLIDELVVAVCLPSADQVTQDKNSWLAD